MSPTNLHNHKLHKFIKKTLHELKPHHKTESMDKTDQIFERTVEAKQKQLLNPETPTHYSTEDFISPILDSTAEMIRDPNIDLSTVKLNCLSEDSESDDPLSPDEPREYHEGEICPFRSRSRSIISSQLMTCLEHGDKKSGNTSPLMRRMSRKSVPEGETENEDQTIEYYSFADMVNSGDDVPKTRKGSCYTISVKDYIDTQKI